MTMEVKNSVKPIDYVGSINTLENRVNDVLLGRKKELLWILEHNTVYTGGTSSNKKDLINKNIKIIKTNRGGKYTVHSPGQKVIYFVLNLNKREIEVNTKNIKINIEKNHIYFSDINLNIGLILYDYRNSCNSLNSSNNHDWHDSPSKK